jgi:pre-mRNA-splicing factor SPF27
VYVFRLTSSSSALPANHPPDIDRDPTPTERAAAEALISAEMAHSSSETTTTHPLLPPFPETNLTPLMAAEMQRIEAKQPLSGVDLTRYEELSVPDPSSPSSNSTSTWTSLLTKAYASQTYLSNRLSNLQSLDANGKETWLTGNEVLVQILKKLEEGCCGEEERAGSCEGRD